MDELARRVEEDKRRRLANLADRVNRRNADKGLSSTSLTAEVFSDVSGAGGSGAPVPPRGRTGLR